ncbi:hypothetical protein SDC9_134466 [bioreactor metagenome]|uniref:Uncharacterized protein n=1 Tax=bioreactor metagenome TaxID=1076179 RepID=A0A645DD13_9ZZZZ
MRYGTNNPGEPGEEDMKNGLEIYKDKSGHFWIEGMCDTIRDLCGEQCEEGCSVFDTVQQIGQEMEVREGTETYGK